MTSNQTDTSVQDAWTDPSADGPKLPFNNGQVSGISEVLNPVLPSIPGPVSADWHFTQWNPGSWFDPAETIINPPAADPVLGQARYGWQADGSSIDVFGSPGNYVYALTDGGGALRDLNLEADAMPPASFTFDRQVTFTAQERISAASDLGPLDGASAANCFTVAFNRTDAAYYDPSLPTISIFLQVELGVAGSRPKFFASFGTSAGDIYNVVPGAEGNEYLPGEADTGALHDVTINLSAAVADMTQWLARVDPSVGNAVLDLSKWSLTGEYLGIESSLGSSLTLDVAHPMVARDPSEAVSITTGPIVSVAGGLDAAAPVTIGIDGISATPSAAGPLSTGDTIVFTLAASSLLDVAGSAATLLLSDGEAASFSGVNASGALTFTDKVAAGDVSTDVKVIGLDLNGSTITDNEGATLDLGSVAKASGADTGIAVQATAPSIAGDVATFGGQAGPVRVTGNAWLDAHSTMMQSLVPNYATAGLNILGAGSPGLLYVDDDLGVVGVVNQGASSRIVVGDGSDLAYSGNGSVSIVGGLGNDTVNAGAGNDVLALGTGSNVIDLGSGDSVVHSEGADLVQAGSGHDTVVVTGSQATINGGYGGSTLDVDDSAGTNTTINVSTGATITGASASVTTINAYGDTTVDGGAGGTCYNEQNGTMQFVGLGGSVTVNGGPAAGSDTLYGAEGSNLVLTSQSHDNVFVANDPRYGGNVTLNGAAAGGGNEFWAGSGNATLIGGTGGDTLVGGTGQTTIVGGAGSARNYFCLFAQGTGAGTHMTVENFGAVSANQLLMFNFGNGQAASALAGATQTSSGTILTLNDGATITLDGVSRSQLNAHNVMSL